MDLTLNDPRAGVPRRVSRLARGEPPRPGAEGRRPGPVRVRARVAAQAARGRLGRRLVAEGVRRPRRDADRAVDLRRGAGAGQGASPRQRPRPGHGRPRRDRPRHRGTKGALPRADPLGRGDLVPGLLRARVGFRPRFAEDQGGQGERRLADHRPEGLDDLRPRGQVVHARRPHRLARSPSTRASPTS